MSMCKCLERVFFYRGTPIFKVPHHVRSWKSERPCAPWIPQDRRRRALLKREWSFFLFGSGVNMFSLMVQNSGQNHLWKICVYVNIHICQTLWNRKTGQYFLQELVQYFFFREFVSWSTNFFKAVGTIFAVWALVGLTYGAFPHDTDPFLKCTLPKIAPNGSCNGKKITLY